MSAAEIARPQAALMGSKDIPMALKSTLVDERGVTYREFRRDLSPRYGRVWRDLGLGYAALIAVPIIIAAWSPGWPAGLAAVAIGGLLLGYVLAYLNNFFHESAHYNLLRDRGRNDRVTDVLMGWLYGSSIAMYRKIHFQHHKALGTTEDSENSYFDPLGIRYLVEGAFGLKVLRTLRRYRATERDAPARSADSGSSGRSRLAWLAISAGVNLAIAAGLFLLGSVAAAAAWLAGLLLYFPFFVSLRQVLEHRSEEADPNADYTIVDHGAVNRLFGDGPLASTLGSAGFNRHAIHHWEPSVSYTRLRDIEAYLLSTDIAPLVRSRSTTYSETFLRLLEL